MKQSNLDAYGRAGNAVLGFEIIEELLHRDVALVHSFSKVSVLVCFLYRASGKSTFENVYLVNDYLVPGCEARHRQRGDFLSP